MRKSLFVTYLLSALLTLLTAKAAFAVNLPALDSSDCQGEQACIEERSDGQYLTLVMVWNHSPKQDKEFCVAHEDYASPYPGFYYDALRRCLLVRGLKRAGFD